MLRARNLARTLLVVLVLFTGCVAIHHPQIARASDNPGLPIYLHHLPGNVTVSGVQTDNVLNTTTLWDGAHQTLNLRYNVANFTLYPALAWAMRSVGTGSLAVWVTVSGAPGAFNATIYDANAAGQSAVVTTSQNVTLNSSPSTPYRLTLAFGINHTFSQSSTIKLSLTVSKVSQLFVWYDSASYPSSLVIPVSSIPRVNLIETFNASLAAQTYFSLNWSTPQRVVFLTVHVADPFGAYHVATATVTITGPGSTIVFSSMGSSLTTNPGAPEKLFAVSWAYPSNLAAGTYVVSATGNDTAGDQDSNLVNIYLTSTSGSTNPNPPGQPPSNSPWPSLYWLIGAGIIAALGLLLAFLFLTRRNRKTCAKCHAKVDPKAEKCPFCGNTLKLGVGAGAMPRS